MLGARPLSDAECEGEKSERARERERAGLSRVRHAVVAHSLRGGQRARVTTVYLHA